MSSSNAISAGPCHASPWKARCSWSAMNSASDMRPILCVVAFLCIDSFCNCGSCQQARGVECRERRGLRDYQQGDLRASENDGVAAFVLQRANHFYVVRERTRQKLAIYELVEDDLIDAHSLLGPGDAMFDA